jgi:hypothetical protein
LTKTLFEWKNLHELSQMTCESFFLDNDDKSKTLFDETKHNIEQQQQFFSLFLSCNLYLIKSIIQNGFANETDYGRVFFLIINF